MIGSGWHRITADGIVTEAAVILKGVIILPSSNGGYAKVYEGQDATSGRFIHQFTGDSGISRPFYLGQGIACERGIYADVNALTEALFLFEPYPSVEEKLGVESP